MSELLWLNDLAWMRATQERALPGTVVIERRSLAADGMGGFTETWAAAGTVAGRVYPQNERSMSEGVGGEQQISITRWFATLPHGTVVDARDRLLADGRTWEIMKVNNDEDWQTAVRCEVVAHNEERRL